jgi:hypothetical protein
MTTMFWVGEPSDAENKFIPNHESYWDENWLEHFGGPDDPDKVPLPFTPKETLSTVLFLMASCKTAES